MGTKPGIRGAFSQLVLCEEVEEGPQGPSAPSVDVTPQLALSQYYDTSQPLLPSLDTPVWLVVECCCTRHDLVRLFQHRIKALGFPSLLPSQEEKRDGRPRALESSKARRPTLGPPGPSSMPPRAPYLLFGGLAVLGRSEGGREGGFASAVHTNVA